ncbi:tyrosine-type recombinase/integrase [Blastococcus sp. Marseille-P5729]|uniref:tyrosine-type recombinase/integrase n=1 Tax=Blastococcus sp. Marseille-P5729 TaxID=2086582 RepID=UPI000D114BC0|nr:tyrosine-type recombinase/integrase [Blastococcus sp. Marseille-P5729]
MTTAALPPDNCPSQAEMGRVKAAPQAHPVGTRSGLDAAQLGGTIEDQEKAPQITFGDVAGRMLAIKSLSWSPGSADRAAGIVRNHLAHWSEVPVASINRDDVLAWVQERREAGVGTATISKALSLFRSTWAEAATRGLVTKSDPAMGVSVRKPRHTVGRHLSEKEFGRLVRAASTADFRLQLLLTGVLGLRWGELAGLNVGDIDLNQGVVMVRRSLARGGGRYVEKSPKTKASARTVPLPASMSDLVRRVLAERQSGHSGPLFVGPETPRLTYHTSRRQLVRVADVAEVPDCTGWHVLRRTAATLALRAA